MKSKTQKTPLLFLICSFLFTGNGYADPGDSLEIKAEIVNLRNAPTTESEILLKLTKGKKVTEIQRKGNWVEIKTHHDDIKTGWIHRSLVGQSGATQNTEPTTRFDRFMQRFNDQNEILEKQNNEIYFSTAKNKGEGTIEIIATQAWLNAGHAVRSQSLNEIFKLWSDIYGVGYFVSVIVFDERGEQHMIMLR